MKRTLGMTFLLLICGFTAIAYGGDPDSALKSEVQRILDARGLAPVLELHTFHSAAGEDEAFMRKMLFISPENNQEALGRNPGLLAQIHLAQRKLYQTMVLLDDYRSKMSRDDSVPIKKAASISDTSIEEKIRRINARSRRKAGVSPSQSDLTDFDETTPPLLRIYDLNAMNPKVALSITDFYSLSKSERQTYLKSLDLETFHCFLFNLFVRSDAQEAVYLPAAIDLIVKQYRDILKRKNLASDEGRALDDLSFWRGVKNGFGGYHSSSPREQFLVNVITQILKVYQENDRERGILNALEYIFDTGNIPMHDLLKTQLSFDQKYLTHLAYNNDERAQFLLQNVNNMRRFLKTPEAFRRELLHGFTFHLKYRVLRIKTACGLMMGLQPARP